MGHEPLKSDVEKLVIDLMAQEASVEVMKRFEASLSKLERSSLELFEKFLNGMPIEQICAERNLNRQEATQMIEHIKRQLMQILRQDCNVRQ